MEARAYGYGRQAAARGGKIEMPAEFASLAKHFWDGVRDVRAEDRMNQDTEWD
jgi:hypothetical protein